MSKLISRIAAIATLALAATPIIGLTAAHAAEPAPRVMRIQIGDLRLSRPTDAAEFTRRTQQAAETFCGDRKIAERLGRLSTHACVMDFNDAVDAELSRTQQSQLKAARRAAPAMIASN
jgi:UrcA family protein